MLNWIIRNRTVFTFDCVQTNDKFDWIVSDTKQYLELSNFVD